MPPFDQPPIAILGGGLTGLSAAYALAQSGRSVRLLEVGPRLGGAIQSELTTDGWLVEHGPNTLMVRDRETADILSALGLNGQVASPAARHRYVLRDGRAQALPLSPPALLRSPLFSFRAKLRVLTELLRRPRRRSVDLSLARFAESHFGRELVDYAVQPFVSGIFAGDAARLSTRHAFPPLWQAEQSTGSLLRAQMKEARRRRERGEPEAQILSFAEGLEMLPRALAARLPPSSVELSAQVVSLLPGSPWKVVWRRDGQTVTEPATQVILAVPAPALTRITVGPLGERPLAALEGIEHPPVASLFLGFRRTEVAHPLDGFGLLVPAAERRNILGVLFSSTLFPGRAPEGHVALTVLLGGSLRPDLGRLDPEEALARVMPELQAFLGVRGEPVFWRHRRWPQSIPQYHLGHERHLELMHRVEQTYPGLQIGGTCRDGISLPASLLAGRRLARAAQSGANV